MKLCVERIWDGAGVVKCVSNHTVYPENNNNNKQKNKKKTLFNILISREIQIHNNDILKVQLQISQGLISIFTVKYA